MTQLTRRRTPTARRSGLLAERGLTGPRQRPLGGGRRRAEVLADYRAVTRLPCGAKSTWQRAAES